MAKWFIHLAHTEMQVQFPIVFLSHLSLSWVMVSFNLNSWIVKPLCWLSARCLPLCRSLSLSSLSLYCRWVCWQGKPNKQPGCITAALLAPSACQIAAPPCSFTTIAPQKPNQNCLNITGAPWYQVSSILLGHFVGIKHTNVWLMTI